MDLAIVTNAFYTSHSTQNQLRSFVEECNNRGIRLISIQNNKPWMPLQESNIPKKCIFLDKDICFAQQLENLGIRLFNKASALELADNKIKTQLALYKYLNFPKTLFSPKRYKGEPTGLELDTAEQELCYPIVVKEARGSLGQQVYMANNREQLEDITHRIGAISHLYQEVVKDSLGRSIRVFVVGDKVLGGVNYVNTSDFRSNMEEGGKAYPVQISKAHYDAALIAAKSMGLDFCAIDFFDTFQPLIIEVNSNAYFRGLEGVGINVASYIIDHILNTN